MRTPLPVRTFDNEALPVGRKMKQIAIGLVATTVDNQETHRLDDDDGVMPDPAMEIHTLVPRAARKTRTESFSTVSPAGATMTRYGFPSSGTNA